MPDYLIFKHNGKKAFMPQSFVPKYPVKNIFAVPLKNAVGTIDIDNAITFMKFTEDELDYDIVAKDFLSEVSGDFDFGFCNVYSNDEIAYTQTRWAVITNVKNGHVISPVITYDLDDYITNIKSIDPLSRKFVIERETPDHESYKKILHVIQIIDKDSIKDEGSIKASPGQNGYSAPWLVQNGLIFTYDVTTNKMDCHDSNLKQVSHPFVDIFNRNNSNFRKMKEFIIHPKLPFGLVVEIGKDFDYKGFEEKYPIKSDENQKLEDSLWALEDIHILYLLRWDTPDLKKQFIPILTDSLSLIPPVKAATYSGFQFSPDGSWMVFKDETKSQDKPVFISLPVDSTAPLFFGEPLYLGRLILAEAEPSMSAWTTDPLGFVVSSQEYGLWKWDLGRVNMAKVIDTAKVIIQTE